MFSHILFSLRLPLTFFLSFFFFLLSIDQVLTRLDDKCKQTKRKVSDTDFVAELHEVFSRRSYPKRAAYEKAVEKIAGTGTHAKSIKAEYLRCGAFYEGPKPSDHKVRAPSIDFIPQK